MDVIVYSGEDLFSNDEDIYIDRSEENHDPRLHSHKYVEIAYVVEGKGIHNLNEVEMNVSKGDLFIINYGVPHVFRPLSNKHKLIVYNCIFRMKFIDEKFENSHDFTNIIKHPIIKPFFNKTNDIDIKILDVRTTEIADIYYKMHYEYTEKNTGYIETLKVYLMLLLIKIFRLNNQLKSDKNNRPDEKYFEDVLRFIHNHFKENICLDDLASIAFLSRNYFCTRFKKYTDYTVFEYIQNIRIEEACKLLRTTDKHIINIAEEVGYIDPKYFNHLFKKKLKKSPREYRASFNSSVKWSE